MLETASEEISFTVRHSGTDEVLISQLLHSLAGQNSIDLCMGGSNYLFNTERVRCNAYVVVHGIYVPEVRQGIPCKCQQFQDFRGIS